MVFTDTTRFLPDSVKSLRYSLEPKWLRRSCFCFWCWVAVAFVVSLVFLLGGVFVVDLVSVFVGGAAFVVVFVGGLVVVLVLVVLFLKGSILLQIFLKGGVLF